ncbi:MAG: TlpA family protein disulfide reductase [Cyclobacteriaceae bacterium]|nr:TlpA family protein disulfide reductase [Cyclobacteriaceae bacterium]
MQIGKTYLNWINILTIALSICGCNSQPVDSIIKISSSFNKRVNDSLFLYHRPVIFDNKFLAKLSLDSTSQIEFEIDIDRPTFASIDVGNAYGIVFVKPGVDLNFSVNNNENGRFLKLRHKGENELAHINNYINDVSSFISRTRSNALMEKEIRAFLTTYDSLSSIITNYHAHFLDSISLMNESRLLIDNFRLVALLDVKLWYAFLHHNNFLVEQIYSYQDGKEIQDYVAPFDLKNSMLQVPLDSSFLDINLPHYLDVLYAYRMLKFHFPIFDPKAWDKPDPRLPVLIVEQIEREKFPQAIQEYMIASEIGNFMVERGISENVDTVFNRFKRQYSDSKYLSFLQKTYDEQLAILPGSIAPDFTGKTPQESQVSLHDFKGKVVYVDVWATWCGPCIKEIPFAIELHKKFKASDQVVFLNVSVDKDIAAWKEKVAQETEWKGIHINLNKEQTDSLGINYRVIGYPKYFLIDKSGKIVSARAPRPSSNDNIVNEIRRLVETKVP